MLRHQLIAAPKQKKSAGVNSIELGAEQRTVFAAIERCVIQRVVCRLRRIVVKREIEEMLAVRKKKRPAMGRVLSWIYFRNCGRCSPVGADAHHWRGRAARKQNHYLRPPGSSAAER